MNALEPLTLAALSSLLRSRSAAMRARLDGETWHVELYSAVHAIVGADAPTLETAVLSALAKWDGR